MFLFRTFAPLRNNHYVYIFLIFGYHDLFNLKIMLKILTLSNFGAKFFFVFVQLLEKLDKNINGKSIYYLEKLFYDEMEILCVHTGLFFFSFVCIANSPQFPFSLFFLSLSIWSLSFECRWLEPDGITHPIKFKNVFN